MASTHKMEYIPGFSLHFPKEVSYGKEMGKFLKEGREKDLPCWLSQFSKTKLRQPTWQTFSPTFSKEISYFLQT